MTNKANRVLTLSAREAERSLAAAIDGLLVGDERAILLTRYGAPVAVVLSLEDIPDSISKIVDTSIREARRAAFAKRQLGRMEP